MRAPSPRCCAGNLLATVHAPDPANRSHKHVIRQRLFLVRVRTMVRNRVQSYEPRTRRQHAADRRSY